MKCTNCGAPVSGYDFSCALCGQPPAALRAQSSEKSLEEQVGTFFNEALLFLLSPQKAVKTGPLFPTVGAGIRYLLVLFSIAFSLRALAGEALLTQHAVEGVHRLIALGHPLVTLSNVAEVAGFESYSAPLKFFAAALYPVILTVALIVGIFIPVTVFFFILRPVASVSYSRIFGVFCRALTPLVVTFLPAVGPPLAVFLSLYILFGLLQREYGADLSIIFVRLVLPLGLPLILLLTYLLQCTGSFSGVLLNTLLFNFIALLSVLGL
ncbi:MAG: hypothetical protein ACQEQV_03860 [Fibrobacterota bacterium]